ncbi:hypothetical protein F4776DRAFT_662928 [Hypoxylon sp. NC0597]|nr:hypothetical protein F4776DRAFT_662928 [Hypoxylon sp. NC0597]
MLVASKVFKHFLAKESDDFRFPLASYAEDEKTTDQMTEIPPWVIQRPASAAELQELLSSTTYVAVDFYTDYDGSDHRVSPAFVDQSRIHGIPGILAFARVNQDDIPEVSKRYCEGKGTQRTFVFFKEGKQVTMNGNPTVIGSDIAGLKSAAEKLGGLAKKRSIPLVSGIGSTETPKYFTTIGIVVLAHLFNTNDCKREEEELVYMSGELYP